MAWVDYTFEKQKSIMYGDDVDDVDRQRWAYMDGHCPELVDYIVEYETGQKLLRMCSGLFNKPNTNVWASTLAKAAKKIVTYEIAEYCEFAGNGLTGIALHLNTDVDTLTFLFRLNIRTINWGLANNPNTPKAILVELAKVNDFDIDEALLHNPNTPEEIKPMIWERYPNGFFSAGYYYDLKKIKVVASGN